MITTIKTLGNLYDAIMACERLLTPGSETRLLGHVVERYGYEDEIDRDQAVVGDEVEAWRDDYVAEAGRSLYYNADERYNGNNTYLCHEACLDSEVSAAAEEVDDIPDGWTREDLEDDIRDGFIPIYHNPDVGIWDAEAENEGKSDIIVPDNCRDAWDKICKIVRIFEGE